MKTKRTAVVRGNFSLLSCSEIILIVSSVTTKTTRQSHTITTDHRQQHQSAVIVTWTSDIFYKCSYRKMMTRQQQCTSSAGPDGLQALLLKNLAHELAWPLCVLLAISFDLSSLPDIWRVALVSPIFKKELSSGIYNYRPISLTCIACKVMESIIRDQLMSSIIINSLQSSDSDICDSSVLQPSTVVINLGVHIDDHLSVEANARQCAKTCFFHLRQIRQLSCHLDYDTLYTLIRALILSRLDYRQFTVYTSPSAMSARRCS